MIEIYTFVENSILWNYFVFISIRILYINKSFLPYLVFIPIFLVVYLKYTARFVSQREHLQVSEYGEEWNM